MSFFHEGQRVWVEFEGGQRRAAIFVGESDSSNFFGGPPHAYVVFPDTREGAAVELDRVVAREE